MAVVVTAGVRATPGVLIETVIGVIPDRVTTDGHDAYPQAIRTEFGSRVWHRIEA